MTAATTPDQPSPLSAAPAALARTRTATLLIMAAGQAAFAITTALFYGLTIWHGDLIAWNKTLITGYVDGQPVGNTVLVAHVLASLPLMAGGALQCVAGLRQRFPRFHRWNGRVFVACAVILAAAGTLLQFLHDPKANMFQDAANLLLAGFLILSSVNAWRFARARNFTRHRVWALRLFVAASASIVIRAANALLTLILVPLGAASLLTLHGPLFTAVGFAQFLLPLALLEWYLRTGRGGDAARMRGLRLGLIAANTLLALGIAASALVIYKAKLGLAFDARASVAEAIAPVLREQGCAAAQARYASLRANARPAMNFDEDELDALGYRLLHGGDAEAAVCVLSMNTLLYPRSANAADSLAEAQWRAGDITAARAGYRHALALDPGFHHAERMLAELATLTAAAPAQH